jgi:hypothetical protein
MSIAACRANEPGCGKSKKLLDSMIADGKSEN